MNCASSTLKRRTTKRSVSRTVIQIDFNLFSDFDLVTFYFRVEGGDFGSQQARGLALAAARLNKCAANQLRLEPSDFSLQVNRVIAVTASGVLGGGDLA